jgi:hypothetical protein
MIFFMVKKYILNSHFTFFKEVNNDNNCSPYLSKGDNNDDYNPENYKNKHKNGNNKKHPYVKVLVDDPCNNRDIILNVTKKQKGVYIWETLDGKHMYVGHSINLYNRISSYFMPSILNSKARRVLRYLNKDGFSNIKLTIYIMNENSSLDQVVELEQHFIDSLKPNLNVDLVPLFNKSNKGSSKNKTTPVTVYSGDEYLFKKV